MILLSYELFTPLFIAGVLLEKKAWGVLSSD